MGFPLSSSYLVPSAPPIDDKEQERGKTTISLLFHLVKLLYASLLKEEIEPVTFISYPSERFELLLPVYPTSTTTLALSDDVDDRESIPLLIAEIGAAFNLPACEF